MSQAIYVITHTIQELNLCNLGLISTILPLTIYSVPHYSKQ